MESSGFAVTVEEGSSCQPFSMGSEFNWFSGMWSFIAAVSTYDAYLVILYRHTIVVMEENPVGQYLIKIYDGDVTLFILSKAAGTLLVLCILSRLYQMRRDWAHLVAGGLSAYQFGLLLYMTFY